MISRYYDEGWQDDYDNVKGVDDDDCYRVWSDDDF